MLYHRNVVRYQEIDAGGWLTLYNTAKSESDLPLALSLIHPLVVPIPPADWARIRGSRQFPYAPRRRSQQCWARLVWGYECPYQNAINIDHAWPFALGGRSTADNGVFLCEIHNRAKSDDVHAYQWDSDLWPSWLTLFCSAVAAKVSG